MATMIIALQTPADAPLLPWWVLYIAVLAITWGTYRAAKSKWWKGCLTAALGWFFVFVTAAITIPSSRVGVILLVTLAPLAGFAIATLSGRDPAEAAPLSAARRVAMSRDTMLGQPNPRSVLRSRIMETRFAAGMPRNVEFIARVRYVSGIGEMEARPVDLFVGGGRLWVAPLKDESPPMPIALRDVLRVDVWPEGDAPPTLRVSWSPPAGDLTRELVVGAIPEVPGPLVGRQLGAIAGAVTDAMQHDERATIDAGQTHELPQIPPGTEA